MMDGWQVRTFLGLFLGSDGKVVKVIGFQLFSGAADVQLQFVIVKQFFQINQLLFNQLIIFSIDRLYFLINQLFFQSIDYNQFSIDELSFHLKKFIFHSTNSPFSKSFSINHSHYFILKIQNKNSRTPGKYFSESGNNGRFILADK